MTNKQLTNIYQQIISELSNPEKLKIYIQTLTDLEKIIVQKLKHERLHLSALNIERLSKALYNIQIIKQNIIQTLQETIPSVKLETTELPQEIKLLIYINEYLQKHHSTTLLQLIQPLLQQFNLNLNFINFTNHSNFNHSKIIEINQDEPL